jgi:hypothetical protein
MKGKKGLNYLSLWWFFCLGVVLTGVVVAVSRFGYAYDVSSLDASILASRISDCVATNGELAFNVSGMKNLDITKLCHIKFRQGKDYFIGIEVYDLGKCNQTLTKRENITECPLASEPLYVSSEKPKIDLKDRCLTLAGIKATYMPECSYKDIYALKNGKRYNIRIIGGAYEYKGALQ